jgi:hypothetical protein
MSVRNSLSISKQSILNLPYVKVNGVPLVDKFTGIQGYDLAHGQFPDGAQIQFAADEGVK